MNSRKIVKRAIKFDRPERIPLMFPYLGISYVKAVPIEDIDEIKDYNFPNPLDSSRYEDIENEIKKSGEKYRLFGWFTLFERAQQLHGMENLFIDFYQEPEQVHTLLNKINDFTLGVLGMDVWLHSDGKVNDIIEEFIDIGLDVVKIQSPENSAIWLKSNDRGWSSS